MNVIPPHFAQPGPRSAAGITGEVVLRCNDTLLLVEAGAARVQARRAVSCLVEPEPGDTVLIGGEPDRPYILAVLERRSEAPVRLVVAGDAELHASGGRLALSGETGVNVSSPARIDIAAPELSLIGRSARIVVDEVVHVGRSLAAQVARLGLVGELLETTVGRVMARARTSLRVVEDLDHLRAGDVDHRAERTMHLHGKTTLVGASGIAKVDAGQIHLG